MFVTLLKNAIFVAEILQTCSARDKTKLKWQLKFVWLVAAAKN